MNSTTFLDEPKNETKNPTPFVVHIIDGAQCKETDPRKKETCIWDPGPPFPDKAILLISSFWATIFLAVKQAF